MNCAQCISFAPMLTSTACTPLMPLSVASCDGTFRPLIDSLLKRPSTIEALVQARLPTVLWLTAAMSAA